MNERLNDPKYNVHLPVTVYGPGEMMASGTTCYFSHSDIRFVLDQPTPVRLGTRLTIFVALPQGITAKREVLVRLSAKLERVDLLYESEAQHLTFTARIKTYDFVRREDSLPEPYVAFEKVPPHCGLFN